MKKLWPSTPNPTMLLNMNELNFSLDRVDVGRLSENSTVVRKMQLKLVS